ncbi:hypothetical protein ACFWFZ_17240 [Streptomyces sp. NPDC060232]|uniref:hypothetical protein n=1 Tax=Streptomyces sp. NPDC060232 TaxID=3347079 RepID=UPI0036678EEA
MDVVVEVEGGDGDDAWPVAAGRAPGGFEAVEPGPAAVEARDVGEDLDVRLALGDRPAPL